MRKTARRRLFQQADDAIVARYKPSNSESAWYCRAFAAASYPPVSPCDTCDSVVIMRQGQLIALMMLQHPAYVSDGSRYCRAT